MMRLFLYLALFALLTFAGLGASQGDAFFEENVRPLLATHCLKCHSEEMEMKGGLLLDRKAGWETGGDSGPVIVPRKPEESLLLAMVKHESDVEAMPPKSKLTAEEIVTLEKWIQMGAPDPRDTPIGEKIKKSDFDLEERLKWWSLQPVKSVTPPPVSDQKWPLNEIDQFILAQLEKKEWSPAPQASDEILFRRAHILLTGLAPTVEQLIEFRNDTAAGAYDRAVDKIFASPHFGEHWARQWLDLVRYGESKAFEQDFFLPHMWKYRDYLTRAFNADVPYDQFVREAFAGDLLEKPRLDPATGFNESVIGPGFFFSNDGHHGVVDLGEDEARVFDSAIKAIGAAFHGLTITCARCHDHKFDAIPDEDYYSLYGILRSSRLHYANIAEPTLTDELKNQLFFAREAALKETLAVSAPDFLSRLREFIYSDEMSQKRAELKPLIDEERNEWLVKFREELASKHGRQFANWVIYVETIHDPVLEGMKYWLHHRRPVKARHDAPSSSFDWRPNGPGFEKIEKPTFLVQPENENVITNAVGSGFLAGNLTSRIDGVLRSNDFVLDGKPIHLWLKGRGATVTLKVRHHELAGSGPTTGVLKQDIESDDWRRFTFPTLLWKGETAYLEVSQNGQRKRFIGPRSPLAALRDEAFVAFTSKPPAYHEVWQKDPQNVITYLLSRTDSLNAAEAETLAALFRHGLIPADQKGASVGTFAKLRAAVTKPVFVRSVIDGPSYEQEIFIRGNHKKPSGKENPRRFMVAQGHAEMSTKGSARREWAEQLLDPENPLTARVRINQLWARIFGRGIVASVDDFGKMGAQPSHPELLDYLARDFQKSGWSTKAALRKMVLSRTFRMSSTPSEIARQLDPTNAFLQHMPIRRMEAESIRDHILATSGELKRDLYGPGVPVYNNDLPNSRAKPPGGPLDGNGRRSIYLEVRRNFISSFLRAFDFPTMPEPAAQRQVTTVPAQSLALLNHPMVHEQSRKWAEKILKRDGSPEDKIHHLHRQAFSRDATAVELTWAQKSLANFASEGGLEAWTALCHLMINRKEFLYVF
ncbi:MAG: PSD1 and planctomycete cytochrome C domain-containing protein [Akkermansiaceae bacterium]